MKLKKRLAVLLALTMLMTLAACGAKGEDAGMMGGIPPAQNMSPSMDEAYKQPADEEVQKGFVENPFVATKEQAVSTLSADVDTASYTYFRKLVNAGHSLETLKSHAAEFRTEEFINYFDYDIIAPSEGELFGVETEIVPCPWDVSTALLRMTLQAEDAIPTVGNNLVFLIDVSGSMKAGDKLPLLQNAFSYLTQSLTARDTVSIVTYSGKEEVVLKGCPGDSTDRILSAIRSLSAYGSTNGEAGLTKAYQIAEECMIEGGNNRIIMASDGDLNVGISSQSELTSFIEQKRNAGVFLSVLGFGTGNYRDSKMEALADNGNGVYYYIDGMGEAEKVFGSDLLGTLYTVAKDVKLQITFDPEYVTSYRLIGYENRLLNEEDFTDDTKDAGEVGAGHRITVCYELTLTAAADVEETDAQWLNLAVSYKEPDGEIGLINRYSVGAQDYVAVLNEDMSFFASVIQTVMVLHDSKYGEGITLTGVLETLDSLDLTMYPDRAEFRELVRKLTA